MGIISKISIILLNTYTITISTKRTRRNNSTTIDCMNFSSFGSRNIGSLMIRTSTSSRCFSFTNVRTNRSINTLLQWEYITRTLCRINIIWILSSCCCSCRCSCCRSTIPTRSSWGSIHTSCFQFSTTSC